jgi:hypothetical protein
VLCRAYHWFTHLIYLPACLLPWLQQNDILIGRQLAGISDTDLALAKKYGQAAAKSVASKRCG